MRGCTYYLVMILLQFAYGGSNILIKISLERGLNQLVLVVYRHVIAMLVLFPFAYVLERKERPPLSFLVVLKIFVLSSVGTTIHLNVYYAGFEYISPTVACALSNVIPSLTFVIAVILRMEELNIRNARGQAKVVGTVICIGGALLFTFWKSGLLIKAIVDKPLIHIHGNKDGSELKHHKDNWIKGSALILISHVAWSAWLILQTVLIKVYPAQLSLNVLICFSAALQSFILSLFFARNLSLWKLEWNIHLLTILYCGVVLSAAVYYLQTWCISIKGPVFAAMFIPLVVAVVALFSAIAFAERLQLSSLVGLFLIIVGLYCVLWGKRLDAPMTRQSSSEKEIEHKNNMIEISIEDQHCHSIKEKPIGTACNESGMHVHLATSET